MIVFLSQRFLRFLLTCLLAWTLTFWALRIVPGEAVAAQLVGVTASHAQLAARRAAFGLDQPLWQQWWTALGALLRGDLGISLSSYRPVREVISEQWGATAELAVAAFLASTLIGIACGVAATLSNTRPIRWFAQILMVLSLSSPLYWIGMLAIYIFGVWLRWLPTTSSRGSVQGLILPAGVLGLGLMGTIAQITAASLRESLNADFIRTAHAKGLPQRLIFYRHLLRVSLPPIVTVAGLQIGFLLGGTALTEALFVRPGVGRVLINAINEKDYPVVQGVVLLGAFIYSLTNLLTDILVIVIDPRRA